MDRTVSKNARVGPVVQADRLTV